MQSTEVLENEILEDAKKKARKITKTAEEKMQAQNREWDKKKGEKLKELEKKYNAQKTLDTQKVMAKLPIDKFRLKNEKIEQLLKSAVDSWYKSLNRTQIIEILSREIDRRLAYYGDIGANEEKRVEICGLSREEAKTILKTVKGSYKVEDAPPTNIYPSIILETKSVRITASIEKEINFLLNDKRAELVEALLGHDFMGEL
jgi:vacuolar-type H+-ATPase subunit H